MVERTPRREVPKPFPIPRMHIETKSAATCFIFLSQGVVVRFSGQPYPKACLRDDSLVFTDVCCCCSDISNPKGT